MRVISTMAATTPETRVDGARRQGDYNGRE
jgi:hypothetical protein